jgi:glycine dehydrogenase
MKLNAAAEMMPVSWPEFAADASYAPVEQAGGYQQIFSELEAALAEMTGLPAVSLQPNSGAQGEFAGLIAIHAYHRSTAQGHRNVVLIPQSAHGTNPASASLAGLKVVVVACDARGNVDLDDLRAKAAAHRDDLSCLMVTYPSTHGVFEHRIRDRCAVVRARRAGTWMAQHERAGRVHQSGRDWRTCAT